MFQKALFVDLELFDTAASVITGLFLAQVEK